MKSGAVRRRDESRASAYFVVARAEYERPIISTELGDEQNWLSVLRKYKKVHRASYLRCCSKSRLVFQNASFVRMTLNVSSHKRELALPNAHELAFNVG
ncbi:hypothetical protein OH492_07715 [Vibrio chagasii]|nr:hypothetical protein [Vibrio chagasii]